MNPMRTAKSHGRDRALAAAAADDGYHHNPRETFDDYRARMLREAEDAEGDR